MFIWGWDVVAMGGRHLDKTILDAVSTTQPIIVWDASEHFAYANTAAMKKVGMQFKKATFVDPRGETDLNIVAERRAFRQAAAAQCTSS